MGKNILLSMKIIVDEGNAKFSILVCSWLNKQNHMYDINTMVDNIMIFVALLFITTA